MKMQLRLGIADRWRCWALAPLRAQRSPATRPSAPRSLFADRRAHMPGDVLTVLVSEAASVTANAQTRTTKGESASANLLQRDGEMQLADVGFDSQFAGGGQIERSGTLLARLSVQIDSVDANGNFIVSGEQLIVVNNEKQTHSRVGLVRPDDIAVRQHRAVVARGGHRHPAARQGNPHEASRRRDS